MTSRNRTLGLALALAAALAVLAGCGGSSVSRADFIKKADALCAATNKANPAPKTAPRTAKEAVAQQAKEIQIRNGLDKKLKALEVPSDAKADFDAYNAGTQRIVAAITRMKADAQKGDRQKFGTDSQAFEKASTDREKIAIKIGFRSCGRRNPAS